MLRVGVGSALTDAGARPRLPQQRAARSRCRTKQAVTHGGCQRPVAALIHHFVRFRYSQIKLGEARAAASAKLNLPQSVPVDGGLRAAKGPLQAQQQAQHSKERASPLPPRASDEEEADP